ncbi:2-succinyl-5-enolpyruvyl-6-hydroxy-3-cyclohexene-1-carboxylate synthase [Aeromicrobium sp. CTD01-1L150]|uniref:2-succinyl-5-enolpyruvyl-6-hydroxy-3- cyclohexene-1-carboxylate synthase n=1 Tax=Aeromicrobium sp. CTD01-1L150 TaxID=3341830 RepID=UPI0035BF79DC
MPERADGASAVQTARRLVERLLQLGSSEAVLAPGSRSGPLALALHAADAQGLLRLHVRVDEREAGFLALGLARGSRTPVAVVTTSGTAVANLHPAMLEALHADVPVVAVTADRPGRLRGTGANQTTDQRHLFPGLAYVEQVDALQDGPAQLNLELDEPLVAPVDWTFAVPREAGRPSDASSPAVTPRKHGSGGIAQDAREVLRLDAGPRTVVVAGDDAGPRARIVAEEGGWPLLAEPTSGARTGPALVSGRLLLDSPLADVVQRVVSLGHPTLSRSVTRLLGRDDVDIVHVGTPATFPHVPGPRVRFARDVRVQARGEAAWLDLWQEADQQVTELIDAVVSARADSAPYRVAQTVGAAVPPGGLLFVGSSNPVRDLDLVARPYPVGQRRLVLANRGLAGIDGTISAAVGAALSRQRRHEGSSALAVMGDLTFLHGANGLLLGPDEPRPDLVIVVVNDDGGSIFATLEQGDAAYADAFERIYATPTGTDIAALCRAHGVAHHRVGADALPDLLGALGRPRPGAPAGAVPGRPRPGAPAGAVPGRPRPGTPAGAVPGRPRPGTPAGVPGGLQVVEVRVPRASRRALDAALKAAAAAHHETLSRAVDALGYRE